MWVGFPRFCRNCRGTALVDYTYWGDYAITYQQGQYFRVARVDRSGPRPPVIKGSSRTVYETFGFFQCAFVKAIDDWKIGSDEERAIIAENKMPRHEFSKLTDGIIGYCKLECRYLAMLMTEFREVLHDGRNNTGAMERRGLADSSAIKETWCAKAPAYREGGC